MKKNLFILVSIALGLCACNIDEPLNLNENPETPTVYHMCIPASFDAQTKGVTFDVDGIHISTQFEASDKIYVYNEKKKALARHWDGDADDYVATALQPSDISSSGRGCTLEGELSFWKLNSSDEWESVSIDDDDTYSLFYQMNRPNYPDEDGGPVYVYTFQKGSAESASQFDFAEANGIQMTKSGSTLTVPEGVHFTNLQSMFRQHLTFKKGSDTVSPTSITSLLVNTSKETLVLYCFPTEDPAWRFFTQDGFRIDNPEIINGDVFLALTFDYEQYSADGDQLIITAYDDEDNVYQCAKNVPTGGFKNSKYYHGEMTMQWKYQSIKPTVTRTDGGQTITPKNGKYSFNLSSDPDPVIFTISGDSAGYCFYSTRAAVITLGGNGTAVYSGADPFIYGEFGLTISLDGDYTIDCRGNDSAIWADWGDLKLATTGSTQTLTVIANDPDYRGIYGNYNYSSSSDDPANLAETGFTVTLSSTTDGPDEDTDGNPDYYTWVYTVTPMLHTVVAGDLGKVVGANGEIYDNATAATAAGTTAEAMIAYVGSVDGVCGHGLAIALTDFTQDHDPDPYTTFQLATAVTAAEATTAIPGGTWRLPTEKDWQYMIWGDYVENRSATDACGFISKLTTAGGTALLANSYWTNTSIDEDKAKGLQYDGTYAGFDVLTKTAYWHVRACLSF